MNTRPFASRLLILVTFLIPLPLAAQTAPADSEPPVPQTFDWWQADGIAATTPWGQPVDTAATRQILSWTTAPEYTSPLVDALPAHPEVVSPGDLFGYPIGKPGVLHKVDQIYDYFRALDGSSERVRFELLGETEEGNQVAVVQVGSEANLARLDRIKAGMNSLADPRTISDADAEELIETLPVIYTFYAGLHSTETGPPEMVMEMAYRLAVSNAPKIRQIRDSVVVFIVPVAEPDGRNRVVDWHRRYNQDVYDLDDEVPGPPYWGKYAYHDNNRDGLQQGLRLTQILTAHFLEWQYPIGHDLHESIPYLYISTGTGPYNPTIDPITVTEWQWMSNYSVAQLTGYGMPGVWTHAFYTGWYPGYLLWVTNTRNAVGRFYETFGNSVPNTMQRELDGGATEVEWYRSNPPRDSTLWSLRNNTNYMQTGAITALFLTAENRSEILRNYYTKASRSLEKGRTEEPFAYVIPADQPRSENTEFMLNLLLDHGIELDRAQDDAEYGDVQVNEGDYVIRMDQPFRNLILTLMSRQQFPADAPRPYDDVAWTFPLMYNVQVESVDATAVFELDVSTVQGPVAINGSFEGGDDWYAVRPVASAHGIRARLALEGVDVFAAESAFDADDRSFPPGTWLIRSDAVPEDRLEALAREWGLHVYGIGEDALDGVSRHAMDMPRIALMHTWSNTQFSGWVRLAFDRFGIPYEYIADTDIAGMDLRSRYDVIVLPHQGAGEDAKEIFQGIDPKWSPLAYTETAEYPTHGFPDATEDMTGGMGYGGLAALQDFVKGGGTFITLGSASTLPVEFGLVREVEMSSPNGLFVPGSIVRGVVTRPENPVTYGYGETMPLYHQFGPYFDVSDEAEGHVVVEYAPADSVFLSGLVENPEAMAEEPAIITEPIGDGYVVLFGFDAMHRFQSHADFAFVWNAVMNWNDLGVGLGEEEDEGRTVAAEAG